VVLESSGDAAFDNITTRALGKWQLARGPLIVGLPLAFRLTPTSYEVDLR
jgi:outer membrane biosynthesis protein TonB